MNIVEGYQNSSNKQEFFMRLNDTDKKVLFNSLELSSQNQLLENLPFQYLKQFIYTYPKEEQKHIYKRLNTEQLRAIYNTLNEDEKKDMANSLEERQIDLQERIEDAHSNIDQSAKSIEESNQKIATSTTKLADATLELQTQKQNLKATRVELKKLDKERKHQLKRVLKASKPSVLDRVCIISHRRTQKLMKRNQELEILNTKRDELLNFREQTRQNIIQAQETIERENDNILRAKEKIAEDKKIMRDNMKRISETESRIRKLSQAEKKVLGRKLYRRQVNTRESILTRRKETRMSEPLKNEEEKRIPENQPTNILEYGQFIENTTPSIGATWQSAHNTQMQPDSQVANQVNGYQEDLPDNILEYGQFIENTTPSIGATWQSNHNKQAPAEQQPVNPTVAPSDNVAKVEGEVINQTQTTTNQSMTALMNTMKQLQEMGINFYLPTQPIHQTQNADLLNEPIANISKKDLIIASYTIMAVCLYAQNQALAQQQNQDLYQGKTKVRKLDNSGIVNLTFLLGMIMFIFSLVLFFI